MAAAADVVGPGLRRVHDSTKVPAAAWDALMADTRASLAELVCPNCHGRLGGRRSHRGTQHFFHRPGENPDCVNRSHEGESDQHRETADLIALDVETIGGRAEREWRFTGGVADIAAWPATGRPNDAPSSILELERKTDTLDEYLHRDAVRMEALDRDSAGNFGRRTVVWVAHNQHAATYLRLPQLYLSQDVARITDGAFYQVDGADAQPAVLDRTEALSMAMDGRMVRVEGAIYRGDGEHGDAWIIRPGVRPKERGKRRRQAPPRDFVPYAEACQREPAVDQPPLLLVDRTRVTTEAPTPRVDLRSWRPCAVCGRPMTAGQRVAHHSCEVSA